MVHRLLAYAVLGILVSTFGCSSADASPDPNGTPDTGTTDGAPSDSGTEASTETGPDAGPPSVVSLAAGSRHVCALISNGTAKCWGRNDVGGLGDGTTTNSSTPVVVKGLASAIALGAGGAHTCAILAGGTMKCWGSNTKGQLGDGKTTNSNTPVDVVGVTGVIAIALGEAHTCAVVTGGKVRCWGMNNHRQLGDGTTVDSLVPVDVPGIDGADAIASRLYHTCVRVAGGAMKCFGNNFMGELGSFTSVNGKASNVSGISGAKSITVGGGANSGASDSAHSCAVLGDGSAQCWGGNNAGQLGVDLATQKTPTPLTVRTLKDAQAISAGFSHTCALVAGGGVRCWGFNSNQQLGNPSAGDMSDLPVEVQSLADATAIVSGDYFNCALRKDGRVSCWGQKTPEYKLAPAPYDIPVLP